MNIPRILKNKFVIGGIIIVVGAGAYFIVRAATNQTAPVQYVTSPAEVGTLTVAVSGSGQISASQQIDATAPDTGKILSITAHVGDTVKAGDPLLQVDPTNAQKTLRDASLSLQSAQLSLQDLKAPPTAIALLQAQDAVDSAQRNLDTLKAGASATDLQNAQDAVTQAQSALTQAQTSATQDLVNAYEDGYNSVSKAFIDLPGVMKDLADLLGTTTDPYQNVSFYQLLVNPDYSTKLLTDYKLANTSYTDSTTEFRASSQTSDDSTKETLITDTLATEKLISNAIEDAQAMLAAINSQDFSKSAVASTINTMTPKISTDVSTVNSSIGSLQTSYDTMINTKTNSPTTIANDELNLAAKQRAYDDLKAGATADDIANAEATLAERQQQLADLKAGPTASEIANAQLAVTRAYNTYLDDQTALANDLVKAPIDGVVAALPVVLQQTVSTGTKVATIISSAQMAVISLNEVDSSKVKVGQQVTLTFDALPDLTMTGHVATVDSIGTVTQGVVNYTVDITLDTVNDQVKPGMSVNANILTAVDQNVLLVPSAAVTTTGNNSTVQVLVNGVPKTVPVQVGMSNDTDTEITSGLNAGDNVVTQTISATSAKTTTSSSTSAFSILGGGAGGSFRGGRAGG